MLAVVSLLAACGGSADVGAVGVAGETGWIASAACGAVATGSLAAMTGGFGVASGAATANDATAGVVRSGETIGGDGTGAGDGPGVAVTDADGVSGCAAGAASCGAACPSVRI